MKSVHLVATPEERLLRELRGLRRGLWLQRVAHAAWRGLWAGLLTLVVGELIARVARISPDWIVALALIPVVAVCGCIASLTLRRPTLFDAARDADRRLRLRQQLATAFELVQAPRTPFGEAQVARAGLAAQEARRLTPEPVRRWALAIATCIFVAFGAALFAIAANEWVASLSFPGLSEAAANSTESELVAAESVAGSGTDSQALSGSLQQLMQPISGDQAPSAEQLASTEQALADRTAASRATQQALSSLADALQQVSAGQAAADALNKGDYGAAVANIAQLGSSSDQLSPEARKALSTALLSASRATSDSPSLADRERRAGDALRYPSYGPTFQAMQNLADTVSKTSQSVLSQEKLSAAWQQLQAAQQRAQRAGGSPPGNSTVANVSTQSGDAPAASGGPAGQTDNAAAGRGNTSSGFQPDAVESRLNVVGVPVEVPLQISAGPSRQPQIPNAGQSPSIELATDTAPIPNEAAPGAQLQPVRAERNAVPLDLRPVVRDYFGDGTPAK